MPINKKIRSAVLMTTRVLLVPSVPRQHTRLCCSYLQHRFQPEQLVLQQTAVLTHVFEGELIKHLHVAAAPTIGGSKARRQPLSLEAVVVLESIVAPEVGDKNRRRRDDWDYR